MSVTITHKELRITLDVMIEDRIAYFGVKSIECTGEYLHINDFADIMKTDLREIELKAYEQYMTEKEDD